MAREDPDVVDEVHRILREEGIQFLFQAQTLNVQGRSGDGVSLTVRTASGEQKIEGSDILAAAGRVPNTAGIGLEEAGVELDAHATSASMTGWRRRLPMSGRSGNAPVARNLRTSRSTTFGSSGTIWPVPAAARVAVWCPIACLPSRHSLASD
jgi:hypothetical protein